MEFISELKPLLPQRYRPEDAIIVVDSREQHPWSFDMRTVQGGLETGDYSVFGLEKEIAVERKSLSDLVSCCGGERERFQRELNRLQAYKCKAVIVEAGWADLEAGEWRSQITSKSVVASVLKWISDGTPFILAGSREKAELYAARFLFMAARQRYRDIRSMFSRPKQDESGESCNPLAVLEELDA